jgi:hypothetical protein
MFKYAGGKSKFIVDESKFYFYGTYDFGASSTSDNTVSFSVDRNTGGFFYEVKTLYKKTGRANPGMGWKVTGTCQAKKQSSAKAF